MPPCVKKLSCTPTSGTSSTSRQMSARVRFTSVRGGVLLRLAGGGQRVVVDLAVGRVRQLVEEHEEPRHELAGQRHRQMGADLFVVEHRAHVGHEVVAAQGHRRLGHVVVAQQGVADLAEFDAVAVKFDLVVGAAVVVELSVGSPAGQVAGAIDALTWLLGVGKVPAGGECWSLVVAAGGAVAGEVGLADRADGDGPEVGVEDQRVGVVDGSADGRSLVGGAGGRPGPVGGVLGRAVQVVHGPHVRLLIEALNEIWCECLPGEVDRLGSPGQSVVVQQFPCDRRHGVEQADRVEVGTAVDQVERGVFSERHRATAGERYEQLEHREVEADRGRGEDVGELLGAELAVGHVIMSTTWRCSIITPLGSPVDPDV